MPGRPEALPDRGLRAALARLRGACAQILRGALGTDAYANYLAHQGRHHPGEPTLSREAFFQLELRARFEGVRRCC